MTTATLLAFEFPKLPVGVIAVVALVALVILIGATISSRMKVAGPNEAFIITGRKGKSSSDAEGRVSQDFSGQKVVMGASTFVLPVVQKLHVMDLSSRRIQIQIEGAVSSSGVKISLDGVAIVKVGGSEDSVRAAAQRFLGQQDEIETFTREVLAGSLRSIVGRLSVEEVIRDRARLSAEVAEEAETSLANQGLALDTLQIQDIRAEGTYLEDLGRPEQARITQEAVVAEAKSLQESERQRLASEEQIATAQRDLALKKSEIAAETAKAEATAAAAGPLEQAARQQEVLRAQELVAEREAELRERVLDTEVRRPADAERYRVETEAAANKTAKIANAEAEREAKVLGAEADKLAVVASAEAAAEQARLSGTGEKDRRTNLADAVRVEGAADADAIRARGQAEADATAAKAEAYEKFGEAALAEMLVGILPQIVHEASAPMAAIDSFTVISNDGATGATKAVSSNIAQGLQILTDLTGVDLKALLATFAARQGAVPATATPAEPAPAEPTDPAV